MIGPTDIPTAGHIEGNAHRLPLRVYYEDTDFSGLVYHANYLRWYERARSDMLRVAGIDQRTAFEQGLGTYAVAEMAIKYLKPARYDDVVQIVSTVQQVRGASVLIHQQVMRDGECLNRAEVVAAFLSPTGRPKRQPASWIDAFEQLLGE